MTEKKVAVFVGSLRKESYSRKISLALEAIASPELSLTIVEIGSLCLYNEDLEAEPPQQWRDFREQVLEADAMLFVTPEYNRSIPSPLKNAIDIGSRPLEFNVWNAKPAAIVSISRGAMGGFGANHHLRQAMVGVNMRAMPQPEVYLGGVANLLDTAGAFANAATAEFLISFLNAFSRWIAATEQRG